ncbi:MAG: hypothetical protein ILA23_04870 [Bacteroidales bacterium]|nr:hypothetical protein [Bacteroidales bacterium]
MKKNVILKGALPVMAAFLVMAACNKVDVLSDDNTSDETSDVTSEVTSEPEITIPYTVTVGSCEPDTRATVDANFQTLRFAAGDKLYITGTNIKGVLDITSGVGETSGATFSGNLIFSGEGTPSDGLALTATLVSAQQTVGSEVSVDSAGAVTVNYPTTAYCSDVYEAIQKYSLLTGNSTYVEKSFSLDQKSSFFNFEITFEDGTTSGTELTAVVNNYGEIIGNANVITTTVDENVVAKFVLPWTSSRLLNGASVKMGDKVAIPFGSTWDSQSVKGKVYNVKKTKTASIPLSLTDPAVGQLIGSDGHNYAVDKVPTGVTAVAMIAYMSGSNGLAITLADESREINWHIATSTAAAHSPEFSGGTWKLPSRDDWKNMFKTYSENDSNYEGLNTAITGAGGKGLLDYKGYWTSTTKGFTNSYCLNTVDNRNINFSADMQSNNRYVRVCLEF